MGSGDKLRLRDELRLSDVVTGKAALQGIRIKHKQKEPNLPAAFLAEDLRVLRVPYKMSEIPNVQVFQAAVPFSTEVGSTEAGFGLFWVLEEFFVFLPFCVGIFKVSKWEN